MNSQFENLRIKRLVMHQIYGLDIDKNQKKPFYNDEVTEITGEGLEIVESRIIDAMGKTSHSVEMEIDKANDKSLFQICGSLIRETDENFVEKSKKVALKLSDAQVSRNIPGGVVIIFEGVTSHLSEAFIGIIKAEIHNGFTLENTNGHSVLKLINDLFLTPSQKFYKVGIFVEKFQTNHKRIDEMKDKHDYKAFVFDQNMTKADTSSAAFYFYNSFMGCTAKEDARKLTRDFYENTKIFINELPIEDSGKMDLYNSLYSYLAIERNEIISVDEFSNRYFEDELKDTFAEFMLNKNIPLSGIMKRLDLVKDKLKHRKLKFTSDVKISAPSEHFKEYVQFQDFEDGYSIVKIKGKIQGQE